MYPSFHTPKVRHLLKLQLFMKLMVWRGNKLSRDPNSTFPHKLHEIVHVGDSNSILEHQTVGASIVVFVEYKMKYKAHLETVYL